MQKVVIYKSIKFPTQSGKKKASYWIMEYIKSSSTETDPLTGWKNNKNHLHNCNLKFPSLDEAIKYSRKNDLVYEILQERVNKENIKSYADNFKFKRIKSEI